METNDIKNIWKGSGNADEATPGLTRNQIERLVSRKSDDFYHALGKGVWINFWIKVLLFVAIIMMVTNYSVSGSDIYLAGLMGAVLLGLIIYDMLILKILNSSQVFSESISDHLLRLTRIFRIDIPIYKVVAPFFNPLLVITGMMYYRYEKYGNFELGDWDDLVVFGIVTILAYVVAYIGLHRSTGEIRKSIDDFKEVLDHSDRSFEILKKVGSRKKRNRILFTVILLVGLLLFLIILMT